MPSIQGIYYYFYAFYSRHNHISFKVTLHSGIIKSKQLSCFALLFRSFAVTLHTVSKMEAKGVLYQLIRLRLYPQNLIRVMPTQG